MITPCKDCLCVPTCKNRNYSDLISTCSIVYSFLYKIIGIPRVIDHSGQLREAKDDYDVRIKHITKDLRPINWLLSYHPKGKIKSRIKETVDKMTPNGIMVPTIIQYTPDWIRK